MWHLSRLTTNLFAFTIFHATQCNKGQESRQDGPSLARRMIGYTLVEFAVLGEVTSHACSSPKVNQNLAHGCTLIELQV